MNKDSCVLSERKNFALAVSELTFLWRICKVETRQRFAELYGDKKYVSSAVNDFTYGVSSPVMCYLTCF